MSKNVWKKDINFSANFSKYSWKEYNFVRFKIVFWGFFLIYSTYYFINATKFTRKIKIYYMVRRRMCLSHGLDDRSDENYKMPWKIEKNIDVVGRERYN